MTLDDRETATLPELEETLDAAERLAASGDLDGLLSVLDARWIQLVTEHPERLHHLLVSLPAEFTAKHPRLAIARNTLFQMHDRSGVPPTLSLESRVDELAESPAGLPDLVAISLGQAIALRMMREYDAARDVARRGRRAVTAHEEAWNDVLPEQRGMVLLHWALGRLLAGDLDGALVDLEDSYEASLLGSTAYLARNAAADAAMVRALEGDVARADEWLARSQALDGPPEYLRSLVEDWGPLAEAALALHRLDLATASRALDSFRPARASELSWSFEHHVRARLGLLAGEPHGAWDRLERAHHPRGGQAAPGSLDEALLVRSGVDAALALGARQRAVDLLDAATGSPLLDVSHARCALLTGDPSEALRRADEGLPRASVADHIELSVIAAVALLGLDLREQGARRLRGAVARAQLAGITAPFALVPRGAVLELLSEMPEELAIVAAWVEGVPDVFGDPTPSVELSERELIVLRELATGRPLRDIARSLHVSPNTIKTQLRTVYAKLGVGSRAEALVAAARLGIDVAAR